MARPEILRRIHSTRVLEQLRRGPASRAELARRLDLTRTTLSDVANALLRQDLVVEDEFFASTSTIGRPSRQLNIKPGGGYFLGIGIAVDRVDIVAIDLRGHILGYRDMAIDPVRRAVSDVIDAVVAELALFRSAHAPAFDRIVGAGLTVPGMVDRQGRLLSAPDLGWADTDPGAMLAKRVDWPVFVDNDANGAALAELYIQRPHDQTDLVYLLIDTGVGLGIVNDGRLLRGFHGIAGEMSHLRPFGAKEGAEDIGKVALAALCDVDVRSLDLPALLARIAIGDPAATRVAAEWSRRFADVVASIAAIFDPPRIVVGGPLSGLYRAVSPMVEAILERTYRRPVVMPPLSASALDSHATGVGAAALAYEKMFSLDIVMRTAA